MSVIKDLVADQQIIRTSEGFEAERSYFVDAIGGNDDTRLYNALTTAGIPQYGDPHPVLPDVLVTRITARPITGKTPDMVKVIVSYSIPAVEDDLATEENEIGAATISLDTGLVDDKTWFDINGTFLTVQWRGIARVTAWKEAEVQRPQLQVNFRRKEKFIPKQSILNFLGRVNSVPWSGFPKKTWLCTKIDATEEKAGTYDVDYGFSYKPETWRLEMTIRLSAEQIAELPPDVDTANGYQIYDVYNGADFNALGLSF